MNNKIVCSLIFEKLYSDYSLVETIDESLKERSLRRFTGSSYVYGEVTFEGMKQIFEKLKENEISQDCDTFLDLGSGIGKAVLSAAMLGKYKKCVGIELLDSLTTISQTIKEYYDFMKSKYEVPKEFAEIEFINGDFNNVDLSPYDVVFTNSTCWNELMLKQISLKIKKMKKNSIVINTDQKLFLENNNWMKIKPFSVNMSWGIAKTFISRKL